MRALIRTAAAAVAAVVVAGTVCVSPAAEAAGRAAVSCDYIVDAAWPSGFMGTIDIVNSGPPIDGWTVQWSWDVPTVIQQSWLAVTVQQGDLVTAASLPWNAHIDTGVTANFGWTALAPSAAIPTDITINGVPC